MKELTLRIIDDREHDQILIERDGKVIIEQWTIGGAVGELRAYLVEEFCINKRKAYGATISKIVDLSCEALGFNSDEVKETIRDSVKERLKEDGKK